MITSVPEIKMNNCYDNLLDAVKVLKKFCLLAAKMEAYFLFHN